MIVNVSGMTCGHCEKTVRAAIQRIAPDATITVDLQAGKVTVENGPAQTAIQHVIRQAGFETD